MFLILSYYCILYLSSEFWMRERGVGRLPRGLEEPREMAAAHLSLKKSPW